MPIISESGLAGALSVADLGNVSPVSLIAGPRTLLSPPIGTYVEITVGTAGFVVSDGSWYVGVEADFSDSVYFLYSANASNLSTLIQAPRNGWVIRGTPIVAFLVGANTGIPMFNTPGAWQSGHIYAADFFIVGPDSHFWSSGSGGTSGGSIPDFAGNEGGTVVDGTVTWTDDGALPTVGNIHLYAITAVPT